MSSTRRRIGELRERGLTRQEIARRLGVAGPTVDYHVDRIRADARCQPRVTPTAPIPVARRQIVTRDLVADLLADGLSRAQVARQLGVSKATVSYHARRLGAPVDARCARRYDWRAIQEYYDLGHSVRECQAQFGFSRQTWQAAVKRGAVVGRPARIPTGQYFCSGVYRGRHNLKVRLLAEGFKEAKCEGCGLTEWQGEPLSLALHHVNGDRQDNRVVNLRLLCANCHSQTDNFAGRNGHRRPRAA